MKKLISAVTSLCMAATMVSAVVPATVGAADSSKGFSIKTYDIANPSADSAKSEITIKKSDIPAAGYTIPSAVYYSEATNNSTGSLLASITTDSKDIKFKLYDPDKDSYTSEAKSYKLGDVEFTTDKYISFAGKCKSKREGYMAGGAYQMACEASQTAAKTDNYFIGCSWMNNGEDYAWAGEKSDSYPFYVFDTIIPADIAVGSYKVMFCDYNTDATGVNDNPCPMVESQGTRYTKKDGNLKLSELTIKVTEDGGTTDPTTTKAPTPTTTTTKDGGSSVTTTTKSNPTSNADIKFAFVDYETQKDTIKAKPGDKIDIDVNITAGGKDVSALDVQFKGTGGIKLVDVLGTAEAFPGAKVSKNIDDSRANYATLKGDTPMVPVDGKSAFGITVEVPANIAEGTYTFGFDSQCKIFKDNTNFNYTTDFTPITIQIGDTPQPGTTTTKDGGSTVTTTTKPPVSNADIKFAFVDYETQKDTITAKAGDKIDVDVNITAGGKDVSALDVQFKGEGGIKLVDVLGTAEAFPGAKVSKNIDDNRANYATLKGDTPMVPVDGKSAFGITIEIPATIADGTYTFGFDSQCKIFKDNTNFNYTTDFTPLTIVIGDKPVTTTTTAAPQPTTTTTVVTTTATPQPTTTTTAPVTPGKTIKVTMWGDANVDGKVNVADVVAIRNTIAGTDLGFGDQGLVNSDVVDPQDITGAACDPAKVQITGADVDHIINYIISKDYDMAKAVTPKKS
ncbi:hypothetical protein [Ruminococcus flavefaciens]|uniref:hypothetical protein n=1 Tax=Ruminococcus flavefaciens TaxID=1265 RepID=UPI000464810E|nr:hypothetical protein [Ruminococcus flavefaciens]